MQWKRPEPPRLNVQTIPLKEPNDNVNDERYADTLNGLAALRRQRSSLHDLA